MKYLKLYQKSLRKVNSMNTNDIIKRLFEEGHISEEEKKKCGHCEQNETRKQRKRTWCQQRRKYIPAAIESKCFRRIIRTFHMG